MKDVQGPEDVLYLFFTPAQESQNKGKEFVGRIFTRTEGRDTTPDLAARDAQFAAIIEWGIRDFAKLARLESITAPTLVANGDDDIMVPTVNSYLLAGHLRTPGCRSTRKPRTVSCSSIRTNLQPRSTPSSPTNVVGYRLVGGSPPSALWRRSVEVLDPGVSAAALWTLRTQRCPVRRHPPRTEPSGVPAASDGHVAERREKATCHTVLPAPPSTRMSVPVMAPLRTPRGRPCHAGSWRWPCLVVSARRGPGPRSPRGTPSSPRARRPPRPAGRPAPPACPARECPG
jgi:hypothetical protein